MDKNIVYLEGRIGTDFKYGKTQEGKDFATFSLVLSSSSYDREVHDSTERNFSETYIRILCFDKRQVEYLRRINANSGQRVCVYGRLSSHRTEYKGVDFIQNNVVVRDLSILKTKL